MIKVADEIVSIKNSRNSQFQILFLCATMSEVKDMGLGVLQNVSQFQHKAITNLQCYFEQSLDKSEFKLKLSCAELVNCPSCPVTNEIHMDDYFLTRIVFSVNKDALNRVKLSNRKMYGLISDCINGRLLTMNDFTYPLNKEYN